MQGLLTFPDIQKILAPVFFSLPKDANHFPPLLNIVGTTATVSTLDTVVGHPYSPAFAGKGGFNRGWPFFPSRLSKRAVSSPQM